MKTYIHIGYPKNASTTLQTDIFPTVDKAAYLGRIYGSDQAYVSEEVSEALYAISMIDSIDYSHSDVERKIKNTLNKMMNESDIEKVIISSEAFSNNVSDRKLIAKRLNALFPDAKIVLIIRNQMDALRSMYGFLVCQLGKNINLSYGRPSVKTFENWILEQEEYLCRSYVSTLKYHEFISVYWDLFGKENVSVLLFEKLVYEPELFFDEMADFLDVDVIELEKNKSLPRRNKGPTNSALLYYKLRGYFPGISPAKILPNRIVNGWHNILGMGGSASKNQELPLDVQQRILSIYTTGNNELQNELDLDLAKYGYMV